MCIINMSGSGLFLGDIIDVIDVINESGSWTSLVEEEGDDFKITTLLGITGSTIALIGLYCLRFKCDKRGMNL